MSFPLDEFNLSGLTQMEIDNLRKGLARLHSEYVSDSDSWSDLPPLPPRKIPIEMTREITNAKWERCKSNFQHVPVGTRVLVSENACHHQVWLFVIRKTEDGWVELTHKVNSSEKYQYFDRVWSTCTACIEQQPNQMAHMDVGGCLEEK